MPQTNPVILDDTLQEEVESLERITLHLGWACHRQLAHELNPFQLTVPQFIALRSLKNHPGHCTMSDLADATFQVSATMTGIVDRLSERQLVQRQRDPSDRRALHVTLTEQGQRLLAEIERQKQACLQRMLATLSPEDRREMLRLMQRYLEATLGEVNSQT
jgi:DNA-binding MarR family transcriptional regulator